MTESLTYTRSPFMTRSCQAMAMPWGTGPRTSAILEGHRAG